MARVKLGLDRRKSSQKKDGSYPIVLSVHHLSRTERINLKLSSKAEHWNESRQKVTAIEDHKQISARLAGYLAKANMYLHQNALQIESMPMAELKLRIKTEIFSVKTTPEIIKELYIQKGMNTESLTDYAESKIERLKIAKKFGNAKAINTAITALRRYMERETILFSEIDRSFLQGFCAYCYSRGNKANTISAYLRPIKTLFREALLETQPLIKENMNPFVNFRIPSNGSTKKRSLQLDDINAIRNVDLKEESAYWHARNYFLFMFNNMGLNIIDLVKLTKGQIVKAKYDDQDQLIEGRLIYTRSKSKSQFSIKLTEESIAILNAYSIGLKAHEDFVFPMGFENSEVGYHRYQQHRKRINKRIKEVAKLAGIDDKVTTYFARHSWATIAKRKMIPISVISEGLGHKDMKTTQIYLDSFDDEVLDNANDKIVA